jgi:hypothetical protein
MALQSVAGAAETDWSKVSVTIPRIRMSLIPDRPAPKRNLGSKALANERKDGGLTVGSVGGAAAFFGRSLVGALGLAKGIRSFLYLGFRIVSCGLFILT